MKTAAPIFLQFKLGDYLIGENAKERRSGLLDVPYYRIHLRSRKISNQHEMLLTLAQEQHNALVYYLAPEFWRKNEFDQNYLANSVVENSAAFSPADVGFLPDDEEHRIVFKVGGNYGFFCSEGRKKVRRINLHEKITSGQIEFSEFGERGMQDLLHDVLTMIQEKYHASSEINSVNEFDWRGSGMSVWNRVSYLSRIYFGCQFALLTPEGE